MKSSVLESQKNMRVIKNSECYVEKVSLMKVVKKMITPFSLKESIYGS